MFLHCFSCGYRSPWRKRLRFSLVMLIIMAVINVGCYVWIDNAVAVIPDNDPTAMVQVSLYDNDFNHGHGNPSSDVITSPEDRNQGGDKAQKVVRGNGDQDDNRTKSYFYHRTSFTVKLPKVIKSSSNFNERYTAVAYKDFGHLKVMPAGDGISDNNLTGLLSFIIGLPCIAGGPLSSSY